MIDYSHVRSLIAEAKIHQAIESILQDVTDDKYRNAFVQLKSELSTWERENYLGLAPKRAYLLRIKYAILMLISDIEGKNSLSNKDKLLHNYEKDINKKLEYILTLDKGDKIDKILHKVTNNHEELFHALTKMSIAHDRLNKIKKHEVSSDTIDSILVEVREGMEEVFARLYEDGSSSENDISYFQTLIKSDGSYIIKWIAEQNHKKANINLLLDRITSLENKYNQLKTASLFGVLGFIISNQLNKSDDSIFGEGYNEDGYDENGYDSNGYDKNGYNSEGYNADEYDDTGLSQDGTITEMMSNITAEFVELDTDLDLD